MKIFWFLLLSIPLAVFSQEEVELTGQRSSFVSVAESAFVIEDKEHQLSIDDVRNNTQNWKKIEEPNPNFDFTTSSYWIKFSLTNVSDEEDYFLETARPLTNIANLYFTNIHGKFVQLKNGDSNSFKEREIQHRKIVFHVQLARETTTDFYLHLASDGEVLTAPIKVWTPEAFQNQNYLEQYILGAYYGLLVFVVVIYFFFYAALKEKSFLFYVLYVLSLFLFQFSIDGFSFQYFFPNNTWMGNHIILLSAGITVVFVMKYAQVYLELKKQLPVFNKIFNVFVVLTLTLTVLSLMDGKPYEWCFPLINGISLISTITILITIIYAIRKKLKVSRLFFTAFLFLIAGGILFILGNFNLIDASMLTEQSIKLGSAFEVTFLSLTMANKFREIQLEKEAAQAEALEKLQEMNQLKDSINTELEKQVKERTSQIEKQKEVLAEKNTEIIDSINYARGIQHSILPSDAKIKQYLRSSFVLFKPKDIVSGDFYWMEHKNGISYFTAADCTGHGVPGAFVSLVGANGLNRSVNEYNLIKPGEILDKLSQIVVNTFDERKDGMDMGLCSLKHIENDRFELQYSGANNPLWIISKSKVKSDQLHLESNMSMNGVDLYEIKATKQPVGNFENSTPFQNHVLEISKTDKIYLFSDGYPDQFGGPKGKKFMSKKLKKLLLELYPVSMEDQKTTLNQTIVNWIDEGSSEQVDDICIFGVEV